MYHKNIDQNSVKSVGSYNDSITFLLSGKCLPSFFSIGIQLPFAVAKLKHSFIHSFVYAFTDGLAGKRNSAISRDSN